MTVSLMKTEAETAYTDAFNPQGALADVRQSAFAQFAETGLPHRRMEDWKWTDLRQLISRAFPPASGTSASAEAIDGLIAASPFGDVARARLVFVDGTYDASRSSLPATGDVDFASACENAGAITPVPGGVGPMTIACLLANTVTACCRANGLEEPAGLTA